MHNIFDLNEMDLEQVRGIAKELGLHVSKKMEKKDIAYMILDKEAAMNALTPAEKPRRGRPRKQQPQTEKDNKEIRRQENGTESQPVQEKKTRGRKPSRTVEETPAADEVKTESQTETAQPQDMPVRKRRGRKSAET